jgi:Flp pilus assembly protein TadG
MVAYHFVTFAAYLLSDRSEVSGALASAARPVIRGDRSSYRDHDERQSVAMRRQLRGQSLSDSFVKGPSK